MNPLNPSKADIKRRVRLNDIRFELINGPRSMLPAKERGESGWLEPDLRLIKHRPAAYGSRFESLLMFTDNTVSRDENFLPPMLRYAKWNSRPDVRALPDWPTVEISLSYFEEHRARVDAHIRALQQALCAAPFVVHGLDTARNGAEVHEDPERDWYLKIWTRNGSQQIEYQSVALQHDELTDLFFAVFDDLKSIMQPISRQGWREAYNWNLNELSPQKSWYWDGETPELPENWDQLQYP